LWTHSAVSLVLTDPVTDPVAGGGVPEACNGWASSIPPAGQQHKTRLLVSRGAQMKVPLPRDRYIFSAFICWQVSEPKKHDVSQALPSHQTTRGKQSL
jgi:hypothetical protein